MTFQATILPERRLLHLLVEGEVDGARYLEGMLGWLGRHPEAVAYDWLYDLRNYRGSVSHEAVGCFAGAYDRVAQGVDRGARSIFVTPDPGFRFWVQACALLFPRRRLTVAPTIERAEEILAEARFVPAK